MREARLPRTGVQLEPRTKWESGANHARKLLEAHARAQHVRVMPALGELRLKRYLLAQHRALRWLDNNDDKDLKHAPRHIQLMYNERP